ncbi:putative zinc- or iron-chelating protein [Solirubrobacter pauli]|uniref:Putative zinc-or iron-chelating protein n=1 Tax=Solirubrobacter pauli TaxID=166793 RepID=A0A660L9X3_9ACTN|nr:YkgJ family cysteine cluster protein [Solirubrobacter pauli]RKQ90653.1 putative zinc- or iron-chelating protein [Solirubrobacter pauli]
MDRLDELERQVEGGNLFAHSALTEHAGRLNEAAALMNGLVGLLIQRGLVDGEELLGIVESAREAAEQAGQHATLGVMVRKDRPDQLGPGKDVDCATRLPHCRGACCSFHFPLSVEEIERGGPLKWDLARPYYNRHNANGYCHKLDEAHGCTIYDERPSVCRQYSCVNDTRIWKDFDAMIPNTEWLDENFSRAERGPVEIFMDAVSPRAPAADAPPA